jgi:hypothetical protein
MKIHFTVGIKNGKVETLYSGDDGGGNLAAFRAADIGGEDGKGGDFDSVYMFKRPAFDKVKKRRKRRAPMNRADRLQQRAALNASAADRNAIDAQALAAETEAREAANRNAAAEANARNKAISDKQRATRRAADEAVAKEKNAATRSAAAKASKSGGQKGKREKLNAA